MYKSSSFGQLFELIWQINHVIRGDALYQVRRQTGKCMTWDVTVTLAESYLPVLPAPATLSAGVEAPQSAYSRP